MGYTRAPGIRDQSGGVLDGGWPYHVSANTTGQLLVAGPCYLDAVVVGKAGSADWQVTIYDAANAGQAIAANIISVSDFNAGGTYPFNSIMENGIYIVVAFSASGTILGDLTFIIADPSKI